MALHKNGWVQVGLPPYGADGLHVRYAQDDSGRWVITDLYVHGQELTSETLRGIALARLEANTNRPGGVDPGTEDDDDPNDAELRLTVAELRRRSTQLAEHRREERSLGSRAFLRRPDGSDPENFYRLVAAAYGEYAAESRAPAREIAEEAGVPVTTVHRWVREARRRGYMPPGRKGKVG